VNRQVQRSLNLQLPDENAIYQQLLALEANYPSGVAE
jgi:hypothetical protein